VELVISMPLLTSRLDGFSADISACLYWSLQLKMLFRSGGKKEALTKTTTLQRDVHYTKSSSYQQSIYKQLSCYVIHYDLLIKI
jgi:hypothetical protein